MITIELPDGLRATVTDEVWSVPENAEIERMLNEPAMQPPRNGHYAPSPDARCAVHVLNLLGGKLVESTEPKAESKKVY